MEKSRKDLEETPGEQPGEITGEVPGVEPGNGIMEQNDALLDEKVRRKKSGTIFTYILLVIVIALIGLVIYGLLYFGRNKPATPQVGVAATGTPSPVLSPTCPVNMQLATPEGLSPKTRLYVILYDPRLQVIPGLDLVNGERISDIVSFVQKLIPDIMGPGDEVSVFQLGFDSYPASRVTRQYSYLTIYPQLYVAPVLTTLTPLPPTSVPTAGFGEVATKNAFRFVSTERAIAEAANQAKYNCQVEYYNENVQSTATAWKEAVSSDNSTISTAEVNDFAKATPAKAISSELTFGGLYYGLYFASVDIQSDCSKYDECDLIIIDDLSVYGRHIGDNLPINLAGVNLYVIMPNCRDINQPNCASLQTDWTSQFQKYGISKMFFWNGVRVENNLLNEIGR